MKKKITRTHTHTQCPQSRKPCPRESIEVEKSSSDKKAKQRNSEREKANILPVHGAASAHSAVRASAWTRLRTLEPGALVVRPDHSAGPAQARITADAARHSSTANCPRVRMVSYMVKFSQGSQGIQLDEARGPTIVIAWGQLGSTTKIIK